MLSVNNKYRNVGFFDFSSKKILFGDENKFIFAHFLELSKTNNFKTIKFIYSPKVEQLYSELYLLTNAITDLLNQNKHNDLEYKQEFLS